MRAKEIFKKLGFECNQVSNIINYSTKDGDIIQFTEDCTGNNIYINTPIYIELLQAINKQVEELGWLK